jgi:ubiquitin-conjugating enzyme E2 R
VNVDEADLYEWVVAIYGPPSTVYEGGCFRAIIRFGGDYPFTPPTFRFLTRIWHPNIYENGEVCISILHPPSNTTQGGELPEERWNPAQNVRTVVMSIISMLNEPNTFSPANVDASIMYRDFKAGKSNRYSDFVARCVADSNIEAAQSDIPLPLNEQDYMNIGRDDYEPGQALNVPRGNLSIVASSKSLNRLQHQDSSASVNPEDFDFDYEDDDINPSDLYESSNQDSSSNPSKANSNTSQAIPESQVIPEPQVNQEPQVAQEPQVTQESKIIGNSDTNEETLSQTN